MFARNFGRFLRVDTTRHIPEGGKQGSWLTAADVGRRDVTAGEETHGGLSCS